MTNEPLRDFLDRQPEESREGLIDAINKMAEKLVEESKEMSSDFSKYVDEHFDELV